MVWRLDTVQSPLSKFFPLETERELICRNITATCKKVPNIRASPEPCAKATLEFALQRLNCKAGGPFWRAVYFSS